MAKLDDDILEQYLAGKSDISKHYQKSEQPEVPQKIDDVVLSLAKFSIAANEPQSINRNFFQKWQVPLSVAAVLVISASLVMTLYDEYGQSYLDSPVPQKSGMEQENVVESSSNIEATQITAEPVEQVVLEEEVAEDTVYIDSEASLANDADLALEAVAPQAAGADAMDMVEQNASPNKFRQQQQALVKSDESETPKQESLSTSQQKPSDKSDITTFALSKSLNKDLLNKEKVKVLSNEIEELKRAKAELAKEQQLLQQTLEQNSSKKSEIQQKIMDTSNLAPMEAQTSVDLKTINEAWNKGDKDEAKQLLLAYLKNKNITLEQLSVYLPDELIEEVSQENLE